jgi:ankyrin repeat protein
MDDWKMWVEFFPPLWVRPLTLLSPKTDSGFSGSTSLLFVAARLDLPWLADHATTWKSYASLPVDVRIPDMSGWSAIHLAADSEAVAMIDWLLENGAMIDAETMGYPHPGRTALHFAASKRSDAGPQMVKTLLEKGKSKATVQTRQGGNTPLHYAIDGRSVETVQALLDSKADPNVTNGSGITPLHKAVAIPGLEEIVRVLLKGHADSNKKTSVGTISAARGLNSLRASRAWMKTYYEVNTSQSALHIAAKVKDTERTVEILLREGHANPNCRDSSGRTPLHVAVVRMDAEAVAKLLVEFKTDLNAQDIAGRTPLSTFMTAAAVQAETQPRLESELNGQASRERVLDLLLLHGSDPTIEGKDKRSPIIIATEAKLLWAVDRLTRKHQEDGQDQVDKPEQKCEPSNGETGPKRGYLGRQASRWMPSRSKSST